MANGDYYPVISPVNQRLLGEDAAILVAKRDLGSRAGDPEVHIRSVVYPKGDQFFYAWEVVVHDGAKALHWSYIVDAQNGTILNKTNRIASCFEDHSGVSGHDTPPAHPRPSAVSLAAAQTSLQTVTGRGAVHDINPAVSPLTWVDLPRLIDPVLGVKWTLNGQYASILNDPGEEAYSGNGVFGYSLYDPHFSEVNLYYQIDKFRTGFYERFGTRPFENIKAHANAAYNPSAGPNAWYDPGPFGWLGELYFNSDLPQYNRRNTALDDAVVFHEYTHAFIDQINDDISSVNGSEEGSISEGTADFMAQSFTGRSAIGTYFKADGSALRNAASPQIPNYDVYRQQPQGAHRGGEFWSAVLWDLRNAAGMENPDVVNNLVTHAVYRLDGSPTFIEFRDAILAEDRTRYGGGHVGTITNVFTSRGIGSSFSDPFRVFVSGPICLRPNATGYFSATVNGGARPYTGYNWYFMPECEGQNGVPCSSYSYAGQGPTIPFGQGQSRSFTIYVTVQDATGQSRTSGAQYVEVSDYCGMAGEPEGPAPAMITSEEAQSISLPTTFVLLPAVPNPSSGRGTIRFEIPEQSNVRVVFYDALGRSVATLTDMEWGPGRHTIPFETQLLPTGTYFVRMSATTAGRVFEQTQTLLIIK